MFGIDLTEEQADPTGAARLRGSDWARDVVG